MNNLLTKSLLIPAPPPVPTISINPITLHPPHRPLPLSLRLTLPLHPTPHPHPIVLLSHGHGPSIHLPSSSGYAPLATHLAAAGLVVLQPTHLNSKTAGLPPTAPGGPVFWRSRVTDMRDILDAAPLIEAAAPALLQGRLDWSRVGAIGHSAGGRTVSVLCGAAVLEDGARESLRDTRVRTGVMLGAPGRGGAHLTSEAAERYPGFDVDLGGMEAPVLVLAGTEDASARLTVSGPAWHTHPFEDSVGRAALAMVEGGKHGYGGVSGWDAKECDDADEDRLEGVCRVAAGWLREELRVETGWAAVGKGWVESGLGSLEEKAGA